MSALAELPAKTGLAVPTGSLSERLRQLAEIHERNGLLCAPRPEDRINRATLEALNRHAAIHEQAARDLREAAALIAKEAA